DARNFLRQIDPGLLPKAKSGGIFRDAVDAEFLGERVEEDVAGLVDSFRDADHAVSAMLGNHPAFEVAAIKAGAAIAGNVHVLGDAFLQTSGRHDDLESRTGGELRLDRFVQERMLVVVDEFAPLIAGAAD